MKSRQLTDKPFRKQKDMARSKDQDQDPDPQDIDVTLLCP